MLLWLYYEDFLLRIGGCEDMFIEILGGFVRLVTAEIVVSASLCLL